MSGSTFLFFEALRRSSIHFMLRTANLRLFRGFTYRFNAEVTSDAGYMLSGFWFYQNGTFTRKHLQAFLGTTDSRLDTANAYVPDGTVRFCVFHDFHLEKEVKSWPTKHIKYKSSLFLKNFNICGFRWNERYPVFIA